MAVEELSKNGQVGKKEQWEQAFKLLYINFQDYSRAAQKNSDDEDIHQARVNSRKILTLLAILDPSHSSGLYPFFKKAQKLLGKVRDADVLIDSFKKRREQAKEAGDSRSVELLKAVIKHQTDKRKKYRQRLSDELPQLIGKKLDEHWDNFINVLLKPLLTKRDANVVMRELEIAFDQKKQSCRSLFRGPDGDSEEAYEALHELRIAAKQLRYTANAASFALNQKFHANEHIYMAIQEQLGEINDKRVWLKTLNSIGREELNISKKTWEAFTSTLRAEVLDALHQQDVAHLIGKSK